jgi:hemoglobin/transferrin/lactoferrin receptor protein
MKKLYWFSFCLFTFTFTFSQTVTVVDEATSAPLEFVSLTSYPFASSVIRTSARGTADISSLKQTDSIVFSLFGYQRRIIAFRDFASMNFRVTLKPAGFLLNEVVVSSSRWEQRSDEIPQKISTIAPHDVILNNPQTAADLLSLSRQVFIQKSQLGGGSPMIRGFATNRVLLVVDGVRMNNAIFRSGNLQNVISIDANAVEHAEVLFGPGSVVYGSDALGGVMSFQTLTPKISDTPVTAGNMLARYASANNERTGHLDLVYGLSSFSSATSLSFSEFGDLSIGSKGDSWHQRKEYVTSINGIDSVVKNADPNTQVPSGYNQINLMQKLLFVPSEKWEIEYGFNYSATSDVPRYDRLTQYRNGVLRYAQWYYGPQRWMMNSLNIQYLHSSPLFDRVTFIAAHQEFHESRHDRSYRSTNLRHQYERVIAHSLNVDVEKIYDEGKELYYGGELILNNINSTARREDIATAIQTPTATRYPNESTWNAYAAYAMMNISLSERLKLSSGLRYNLVSISAAFDSSFLHFQFPSVAITPHTLTGSIGGVYKISEQWQAQVNFSTGFRAPNIDDMGKIFESSPGSLIVPNPRLQSEYAYNTDVRLIGVVNDVAKIDFSGFYTILTHAIVVRPFRLNGSDSILFDGTMSEVRALQNTSDAYVYGLSTSFNVQSTEHLSFRTTVNWQYGRELENVSNTYVPMRHVAPLFADLEWRYALGKMTLVGSVIYNGKFSNSDLSPSLEDLNTFPRDGNGKPYSPSWFTVNVKGRYWLFDAVQVTGGIENILDTRYRTYSSGISAPGRNFIIALHVLR